MEISGSSSHCTRKIFVGRTPALQKVLQDVQLRGGFPDLPWTTDNHNRSEPNLKSFVNCADEVTPRERQKRQGIAFPPGIHPLQVPHHLVTQPEFRK